jgi:hypothetical protein
MKKIIVSIFILIISGWSHITYSQDAFSELKFTLTANGILGGNTIQKSWAPTGGVGFEVSTPYYFGNFELGARYTRYNELEFENSGFHSTYIFVGWNYSHYVSEERDLAIVPGFRFGSRYMIFDEEKTYREEYIFSRFESEFSYEVNFRIQYRINKSLEFYTSAAINQTRFKIPYAEWVGTASFSFIFNTSEGMENFLK